MANLKLATCGKEIKLWEVSSTNANLLRKYLPHNNIVSDISWSYDGQFLASASNNGDNIVLAYMNDEGFSTGELAMSAEQQCIQFSRVTARYLLTGGKNGDVNAWDLKTRKIKKVHKGHTKAITRVRFNVNDTYILSGSEKGDIILHNVMTGQGSSPLRAPGVQSIRDLKYSHTRRSLFSSASDDGSVALWDAGARKLIGHFKGSHQGPATCVAFSPMNDSFLVSAGLDKKILLYDITAKNLIQSIVSDHPLNAIDFFPDGFSLIVGSSTGKVSVYDLRQTVSKHVYSFSAHESGVQCLAFQTIKPQRTRTDSTTTRIASHRSASSSPKRSPFSSSSSPSTRTSESHSTPNKKVAAPNGSLKSSHSNMPCDVSGAGDRMMSENHMISPLSRSSISNLSDDVFSPLRKEPSPEPYPRKQPIGAGSSNIISPLDILGDRPATTGLAEADSNTSKKIPEGITLRKSGPAPTAKRRSSSSSPRAIRNLSKDKGTNDFFPPLIPFMDAGLPPLPLASSNVVNGLVEDAPRALRCTSGEKISATKILQGDEVENISPPLLQSVSPGAVADLLPKSSSSSTSAHSQTFLPSDISPFTAVSNASSHSLNGVVPSLSLSSSSSLVNPTSSTSVHPSEIVGANVNAEVDNNSASVSATVTVNGLNEVESPRTDNIVTAIEEVSENFSEIARNYFLAFRNDMIREFQIQKAEIREMLRTEFSKYDAALAEIQSLREENKRLRAKF